jgi:hypothetical protein
VNKGEAMHTTITARGLGALALLLSFVSAAPMAPTWSHRMQRRPAQER